MKAYLRVKIKSLAAEAQIIRREERREKDRTKPGSVPSDVFFGLRSHRVLDVRREARAASLAYGFLRGRDYKRIEASCHEPPNWKRVEDLVRKYGEDDMRERMQRFSEWRSPAT